MDLSLRGPHKRGPFHTRPLARGTDLFASLWKNRCTRCGALLNRDQALGRENRKELEMICRQVLLRIAHGRSRIAHLKYFTYF